MSFWEFLDLVVYIVKQMPWFFYVGMTMFFGGIYFMLIAPLIFRLWVIPKIERQCKVKLRFDSPSYDFLVAKDWGIPPMEISFYIFSKYTGISIFEKKKYGALSRIKYDVSQASKFDIFISFVTVFMFYMTITCGIIVGICSYFHLVN